MLDDYCVDAGVDLFGTGDRQLQQLGGADLTRTHQSGQFQRITTPVLIEAHTAGRQRGQGSQVQRGTSGQPGGSLDKLPSCYPGHRVLLVLIVSLSSGLKGDESLLQRRLRCIAALDLQCHLQSRQLLQSCWQRLAAIKPVQP